MTLTRNEHLFSSGPKRILALDGGGIRGIATIQFLKVIEELVRSRSRRPDAVLSDYFDLIGGTSTGSIIAAGLALGWPVKKLETLYDELGRSIFVPSLFRKGLLRPKFNAGPLRNALRAELGDITLGGEELKTGLAVVAKRLDTGSPWVLHNNPKGLYFDASEGSNAIPNRDFLLREVVRASTAAPHYFEPERIEVARGTPGAFVDGGVSPHNNPALQLLMLATLKGHRFEWPLGADRLLLVSLGTGSTDLDLPPDVVMNMKALELAGRSLASLMNDASNLNETLLQWLSESPTARSIDSEIRDLEGDVLGGRDPWLTYLRYDVRVEPSWLESKLSLRFSQDEIEGLLAMDQPKNMDTLALIGRDAARLMIEAKHFPTCFDVEPEG